MKNKVLTLYFTQDKLGIMKTTRLVEEFHFFFFVILVYLFLMGRLGLSWLVFKDVCAFSKNLDTCSNTA